MRAGNSPSTRRVIIFMSFVTAVTLLNGFIDCYRLLFSVAMGFGITNTRSAIILSYETTITSSN